MARIRDDVKISEMAIPGTHDSATFKMRSNIVATQCLSFDQQLKYGIRYFDIRIRHFHNDFALHHGMVYLHLNFADFLRSVNNFLVANPTEVVLFRLKEELRGSNNNRNLSATLNSYLVPFKTTTFKQTSDRLITVGSARGKFIILADNPQLMSFGVNYKSFKSQDNYILKTIWCSYRKWEDVKAQLNSAVHGDANSFYLNYLSGAVGALPYFVASGHSSPGTSAPRLATGGTTPGWRWSYPDFPRLNCFLGICTIAFEGINVLSRDRISIINDKKVGVRSVGIVIADYPGDSLLQKIVDNNFRLS